MNLAITSGKEDVHHRLTVEKRWVAVWRAFSNKSPSLNARAQV